MKVGILGAGSWGIALAVHLETCGHEVTMWEFSASDTQMLIEKREHPIKLPGIKIKESILITNDIQVALKDVDYVIAVVPSQTMRITLQKIKSELSTEQLSSIKAWIIASKGIELGTRKLMTEIFSEEFGEGIDSKLVVLSGPSHAEEVSRNIPTTIVAASKNNQLAEDIQMHFSSEYFRVYTNDDVIGVELCASIKNVIALAAGICDGLGFGDNTKGALLTRGMVEMARLGKKMGANELTFTGLAGFGDLVTTCISRHSRNRKMGELIAQGLSLEDATKKMIMVAEGVQTTKSVFELANSKNVEMPITNEVYNVLFQGKNTKIAVKDLMIRQFKAERL